MADPVKQPHPELVFKLLDRLADSGLGREDHLGRFGESALADNLHEDP